MPRRREPSTRSASGSPERWRPRAIRVNVVRPGVIDTEIHARGGQPNRIEQMTPLLPIGRAGRGRRDRRRGRVAARRRGVLLHGQHPRRHRRALSDTDEPHGRARPLGLQPSTPSRVTVEGRTSGAGCGRARGSCRRTQIALRGSRVDEIDRERHDRSSRPGSRRRDRRGGRREGEGAGAEVGARRDLGRPASLARAPR